MEGHADVPSQSAEDQQESEALVVIHPGPQPGGHLQAALKLDTASRYMSH